MRSIRKRFSLIRMVVSLAATAVLSLAVGVTEARADDDDSDSDSDDTIVLFVDVDETSFAQVDLGLLAGDVDPNGFGPFNIQGEVTGSGEGSYQCWGWSFDDGSGISNVSQVYNIRGGSIMTQGHDGGFDGSGLLAIVGGTGKFSGAKGQAFQDFTGPGFNFTITFFFDDDDDDDDD